MLVRKNNQPKIERHFEAMLVWMDETDLDLNKQFLLKHTTQKVKARVDAIRYGIDVNTLKRSETKTFQLNQIGRVVLTSSRPLLFDSYEKNRQTGSFILIDPLTHNTSAVGMIINRVHSEQLPSKIAHMGNKKADRSLVSVGERETQLSQKAMTYWVTGLHASGKNDIAYELEHYLFDEGRTVIVLNGSMLRSGLNRELGFDKADRDENLRRVAEMAKLLNDQGLIVIAVFISPDSETRLQVKEIIGTERYKEILIDTSVEVCQSRDTEGLYEKAAQGKLRNFPGVDSPYETGTADIILNDLDHVDIKDLI